MKESAQFDLGLRPEPHWPGMERREIARELRRALVTFGSGNFDPRPPVAAGR